MTKPLVFIHQMGKVGSQALANAINLVDGAIVVRRDHGLTPTFSALQHSFVSQTDEVGDLPVASRASLLFQAEYADTSRALFERANKAQQPVFVATGFREPLSYLVSSCFQSIGMLIPAYQLLSNSDAELAEVMESVVQLVVRHVMSGTPSGCSPVDLLATMGRYHTTCWWNVEWEQFHNINWADFERAEARKTWCAIKDHRTYSVYRIEDGIAPLASIAQQILSVDDVAVPLYNASVNKPYAAIYERVRARIEFSDEIRDFFWGLPYVKKIYPHGDAEYQWRRWKEGSLNTPQRQVAC